MVIVGY